MSGPLLRAEEAQAAQDSGAVEREISARLLEVEDDKPAPKKLVSAALSDDLTAIQLHAFQKRLADTPEMALRLLAFSLSREQGTRNLFGLRIEAPKNLPSETDGLSVDERLMNAPEPSVFEVDLEASYAEFCQKSDDEIMAALVASAVRTIAADFGSAGYAKGLFNAVGTALSVNPRDIWRPTKANFWGRMPKGYLEDTFRTLTGLDEDSEQVKAFAKGKKGDVAASMEKLFSDADFQILLGLTPEQIDVIDNWMPAPEDH
ncbi:hypothetical protein KM176_23720 [Pseudooceanicola sp. CBS1P-1]|uniref:Uncharacterized protein n=1 Tax=Pseudooceanicola albus TaxID=2692189 RepID=A0A6L7GBC6_9RHOB|nr:MULTISPECIES: hypothetical protein [Pseudooceanicola]MBT9386872.1 hypothetical protein [Pseudooceanicola endophyticus]MXN20992.1 hypothetical protein [Pseudooceanicola albus]